MAHRSPIVSVLGHVDHGKSSILDAIRQSDIVSTEAGKITQAIGASIIPLTTITSRCGALLKQMGIDLNLPGLLFIDTPGHAAFTTLRKRGGSLADIAIVVIDINEGFKPQTIEAIEILRAERTPFIICANKLDRLAGFRVGEGGLLTQIAAQNEAVRTQIDQRIYEIVGKLHEHAGLEAERFDRVDDFTRKIAIIPTSATASIGIGEVLVIVAGLAQRYLEKHLRFESCGPAKGTVLEVKEDKGLGSTIDVILYDGTLRVGDTIVIGGIDAPIVTKVRGLLEPAPLAEMRDRKSRYAHVDEVHAATGVKIAAPGLAGATAGTPVRSCGDDEVEACKQAVQEEIGEVLIETEKDGIIIKADTLGSLEALTTLLHEKEVPIRKARVGPISKKDIADAQSNAEGDPMHAIILGFNIPHKEAEGVTIITDDVIYRVIERYEEWFEQQRQRIQSGQLDSLIRPCKLEFLRNCTFRQSNPAIIGVEITAGVLTTGAPLMKDGMSIGIVKSMQKEKESVKRAEKGAQLAVSIPGCTVGRRIVEGDILYSAVPESDFREIKKLAKHLRPEEIETLKEIAAIMRKHNPMWGI